MNKTQTIDRYPLTLIRLHWLTLVLIAATYALMEFKDIFPRGSDGRELMKATHYSLGLTILGLTLARIVMRFASGPAPAIEPPLAPLQAGAAKVLHLALYAFLVAMPIIGWLLLSAEGKTIVFYGLSLPSLIGPDKIWDGRLEEVHETLATVGYVLIGLHAAAALVHHHVLKDTTLRRMLPHRSAA